MQATFKRLSVFTGRVFAGFKEMAPQFPPTFKVCMTGLPGTGFVTLFSTNEICYCALFAYDLHSLILHSNNQVVPLPAKNYEILKDSVTNLPIGKVSDMPSNKKYCTQAYITLSISDCFNSTCSHFESLYPTPVNIVAEALTDTRSLTHSSVPFQIWKGRKATAFSRKNAKAFGCELVCAIAPLLFPRIFLYLEVHTRDMSALVFRENLFFAHCDFTLESILSGLQNIEFQLTIFALVQDCYFMPFATPPEVCVEPTRELF